MIIEIINKPAEKKKDIEVIEKLMSEISLPEKHFVKQIDDKLYLLRGRLLFIKKAELKLSYLKEENVPIYIIEVHFENEKDLEKLKDCFKDSKTKFRLIVGDKYYY